MTISVHAAKKRDYDHFKSDVKFFPSYLLISSVKIMLVLNSVNAALRCKTLLCVLPFSRLLGKALLLHVAAPQLIDGPGNALLQRPAALCKLIHFLNQCH